MSITRKQLKAVGRARQGRRPTLTDEQVRLIRETVLTVPKATYAELAERLQISATLLADVCRFRKPYDREV